MKSRASIKGHPIHPILIVFPLAFFAGTLLFDILAMAYNDAVFWVTAYYMQLAGIIGGVLAAIPGAVDYIFTVPPKSSGKKRAAKHGIVNASALVLFTIAWFLKADPGVVPVVSLVLEIVAAALLVFGGWMGGTLVYRNQIGVNPRYASAGKWKEIYVPTQASPVEVAHADELKPNQMKLVHAGDKRIVLARTETGYVAFSDHCMHRGGSLAGGAMICGTVQCPWHGSQFDVTNGAIKAGPAQEPIVIYTVKEENGKVMLTL
jgi:uncharacterized membrane protein/nitrite reductase/ring-hydroxylating ferredoxin subunit